jgi:hypothetical protein
MTYLVYARLVRQSNGILCFTQTAGATRDGDKDEWVIRPNFVPAEMNTCATLTDTNVTRSGNLVKWALFQHLTHSWVCHASVKVSWTYPIMHKSCSTSAQHCASSYGLCVLDRFSGHLGTSAFLTLNYVHGIVNVVATWRGWGGGAAVTPYLAIPVCSFRILEELPAADKRVSSNK